jgi:rfaE bifunctional protein nucleotidyltransferase chain/domain
VLVDPKRRTLEAYQEADIIKPNAGEMSAASGMPCSTDAEIEAAAGALAGQFDGTLLVTRAEAGMSLVRRGLPTRLIVGLNSDSSARKLKGPTRPIQTEADRARIVGASRAVDLVVLFDDLTPLSLIEAISPDVLVKGADYSEEQVVGGDVVKARGGRSLFPLMAGGSSTKIAARMRS